MGAAGILNVDKPAGWTSFDVVARLRRVSGVRRVGHAGTLDPLATGVLPVCLGRATRVVEYLADATKVYRATVHLGIETTTYDREGEIVARRDCSGLPLEPIGAALDAFRGRIVQTPPMYSALKRGGQRLYELARRGVEVEREARPVEIHRIALVSFDPPFLTIELRCSKGTYVRSLAHDLGRRLGCGGSLEHLVRLEVGPFRLVEALPVAAIEAAFRAGRAAEVLYPLDWALLGLPTLWLGPERAAALAKGQAIAARSTGPAGQVTRAYEPGGTLLGVVEREGNSGPWRPRKVLAGDPGNGGTRDRSSRT